MLSNVTLRTVTDFVLVGVFQAYLSTHQLSSYSESTTGWIFSVYIFLSFFCGLQIGPVFDAKGPRYLVLAGSILLVACMLLMGACTEYYQFMIVFGVIGGVGTSLIFTPAISAIGHFFLLKRGSATGIGAAGGSVGGVVFPLMLKALIPKVGWAWSTRILGFICLFLLVICNLTIRSRLPPKPGQSVLPDFRIFRNPAFALTTLGVFCMEWGLFIPITYLTSFALSTHSINETFSYQLIAILNAGSSIGRWVPGYFADRIGRFNTMILALGLCLLTTIAFWLTPSLLTLDPSKNQAAITPILVIYAILFGFASGSNISLTPVCVGQMCDTEEYGRYYATCYTVVSFGTLTGIPIAGALLQATKGAYWGVIIFTGGCYAISVAAFMWARVLKVGTGLQKVF